MKIEIGPRDERRIGPSWVTVDIVKRAGIDIAADWTEGLPFPDRSVSILYASHVLEHIWWHKTQDALAEAWRVLRVGGALELHVPDLEAILRAYQTGAIPDDWRRFNDEGDHMKWINGRLFAYDLQHDGCGHHSMFDRGYLHRCLEQAGFEDIRDGAPVRNVSKHEAIDLAMTAVKT